MPPDNAEPTVLTLLVTEDGLLYDDFILLIRRFYNRRRLIPELRSGQTGREKSQ